MITWRDYEIDCLSRHLKELEKFAHLQEVAQRGFLKDEDDVPKSPKFLCKDYFLPIGLVPRLYVLMYCADCGMQRLCKLYDLKVARAIAAAFRARLRRF